MERKEIESAVEAILFASGEAVQLKRLCAALQLARPAVERGTTTPLNGGASGWFRWRTAGSSAPPQSSGTRCTGRWRYGSPPS